MRREAHTHGPKRGAGRALEHARAAGASTRARQTRARAAAAAALLTRERHQVGRPRVCVARDRRDRRRDLGGQRLVAGRRLDFRRLRVARHLWPLLCVMMRSSALRGGCGAGRRYCVARVGFQAIGVAGLWGERARGRAGFRGTSGGVPRRTELVREHSRLPRCSCARALKRQAKTGLEVSIQNRASLCARVAFYRAREQRGGRACLAMPAKLACRPRSLPSWRTHARLKATQLPSDRQTPGVVRACSTKPAALDTSPRHQAPPPPPTLWSRAETQHATRLLSGAITHRLKGA